MNCWKCFIVCLTEKGIGYATLRLVKRFLNGVPIIFVTVLVLWSYYEIILRYVFSQIMSGSLMFGMFHLCLYHIVVILQYCSYLRCVFTTIQPIPMPVSYLYKNLYLLTNYSCRIFLQLAFVKDAVAIGRHVLIIVCHNLICNKVSV
jgi:hypothetical protein